MHRSSKQRRQQLARSPLAKTGRWKRALLLAACAAGFATGSFLFAEEGTTLKRRLPTRSVMPVKLMAMTPETGSEAPAPSVRPQAAQKAAEPAKLVGSKAGPFRPVTIQAVPAPTPESEPQAVAPVVRLTALPAVAAAKPEVKFKPIPSKRKPVESRPEETLAPIVSASSFSRPREKSAAATGKRLDVSVAPLSPWMQDVRAVQPEDSGVGFQPAR